MIGGHGSDDALEFVRVKNETSVAAVGRKREMKSNREVGKAGE